jgi:hypothetical protein
MKNPNGKVKKDIKRKVCKKQTRDFNTVCNSSKALKNQENFYTIPKMLIKIKEKTCPNKQTLYLA